MSERQRDTLTMWAIGVVVALAVIVLLATAVGVYENNQLAVEANRNHAQTEAQLRYIECLSRYAAANVVPSHVECPVPTGLHIHVSTSAK